MDNLRKQVNIKKVALISILVSLSVILSIFDRYISSIAFPYIPTAKIGLANIIILVGVYNFDYKETLLMVILKSTLANLFYGGPISFVIGFSASIMSFIAMSIAWKTLRRFVSPVSVSVIGGVVHIITQLLVVQLLYQVGEPIIYYGAVLIFVSLITSIIVGLISIRINTFIKQIENS
ncbi:MAG: Gx transporter family protein [Bacilli bacterium]|nr:Gx transporter family protein [Bacilli bacterium]